MSVTGNQAARPKPSPVLRVCGPCDVCNVRDFAFCSGLEPGEIGLLSDILTMVSGEPGTTLFFEGDDARHVYSVTEGCMKLYKLMPDGRRQITGFLFPGDFLGVPHAEAYSVTAEAVGPVSLCRFGVDRFQQVSHSHPHLEQRLFAMAMDEISVAQEHMLLLGRKTAKEKLASFLQTLAVRQHRRGVAADPVHLPMSRSDIADFLGLTIETVSRTFTQLRKEGVISLPDSSHAAVLDRDTLETLAEGDA